KCFSDNGLRLFVRETPLGLAPLGLWAKLTLASVLLLFDRFSHPLLDSHAHIFQSQPPAKDIDHSPGVITPS
ncbi:MAG: hypothetical protein ACOCXA_00095, partial [Planctomycetota bacterium]